MKKLLLAATVALFLFGCQGGVYFIHHSGPCPLKEDASAIYVSCEDQALKIAVENALLNRHLRVKSTDLDNDYSKIIESKTSTEKQSVMSSVMEGLRYNGKISGSKELYDGIKDWNNIKDQVIRVKDYQTLVKTSRATLEEMCSVLGITHFLFVAKNDNFHYTSKLVAVPSNTIEFVLYFEADQDGYPQIVANDQNNANVKMSERPIETDQKYNCSFAEYLVGKIQGRK
jgi:hypothetical protein